MKKLLLASALAMLAAPAWAKDYTVKMITDPHTKPVYRFEPAKLKITQNDTVHFINAQDDTHDVMFEDVPEGADMAMSPMLTKKGKAWSYTFTTPGIYRYHCHPHEALGMKGVIVVGNPAGEFVTMPQTDK